MTHDVFLSHSSEDQAVANAACQALEAAGIRCWIAPRDIRPGDTWGGAIVEAIGASRVMVLIFSSHANGSPQVMREVERAVQNQLVIVPVRIEDVLPTSDLEYFLSSTHWLDAHEEDRQAAFQELVRTVASFLERSPEEAEPPASAPGLGRPARSGWTWAAAAAGGVLLIAALVGLFRMVPSSTEPDVTPTQVPEGSMELAALIDSLLADETVSGEPGGLLFDWMWGSEADDPIDWDTVGIKPAPEGAREKYGPFERRGSIVLTIDGEVTHHVLAQKKVPGHWNVVLRGPKVGYTDVFIESQVVAPGVCDVAVESLSGGLSVEPYRCKKKFPIYSVTKSGKQPAWLRDEYSGGSAGCSRSLQLIFDQTAADLVECYVGE